MKYLVIESYGEFNFRRYGNPWIAKVDSNGKPDFTKSVGRYTGGYNKGEAGDLYLYEAEKGIYMYGQKDHRKGTSENHYIFVDEGGNIEYLEKTELVEALKRLEKENENNVN